MIEFRIDSFFFSQHLKNVLLPSCLHGFWWESRCHLSGFSLYGWGVISASCIQGTSLSFVFLVELWCFLVWISLSFTYFEAIEFHEYIGLWLLQIWGNFSHHFLSSFSVLSSASRTHDANVGAFVTLQQVLEPLLIFVPSLFTRCCSDWVILLFFFHVHYAFFVFSILLLSPCIYEASFWLL